MQPRPTSLRFVEPARPERARLSSPSSRRSSLSVSPTGTLVASGASTPGKGASPQEPRAPSTDAAAGGRTAARAPDAASCLPPAVPSRWGRRYLAALGGTAVAAAVPVAVKVAQLSVLGAASEAESKILLGRLAVAMLAGGGAGLGGACVGHVLAGLAGLPRRNNDAIARQLPAELRAELGLAARAAHGF